MGSKNGRISGPCRAKRVGTTMCVDDTGPEQRSNKSINRQMVSEKTVVQLLVCLWLAERANQGASFRLSSSRLS